MESAAHASKAWSTSVVTMCNPGRTLSLHFWHTAGREPILKPEKVFCMRWRVQLISKSSRDSSVTSTADRTPRAATFHPVAKG
eukprot:9376711-Pyramimonas_sp.AAC.1